MRRGPRCNNLVMDLLIIRQSQGERGTLRGRSRGGRGCGRHVDVG